MTNLEYIRSMSAEELAKFITDCADACYVKGYFGDDCTNCPLNECATCDEDIVAKWLNEERRNK